MKLLNVIGIALLLVGCSSDTAKVISITDGDTIKVEWEGKKETLRVSGIDTPETKDPRYPVQCYGPEATQRAKELLAGKTVTLETKGKRGRYGRLITYIRINGKDYGEQMIYEGFAFNYPKYPHERMVEYTAAEDFARENSLGIWDVCNGEKK